uniref:Uncharacterized protein n=1 Tax=Oryza meridionalis TaxID=40149 RepID=A0A0E0E3F8_9ORYZ
MRACVDSGESSVIRSRHRSRLHLLLSSRRQWPRREAQQQQRRQRQKLCLRLGSPYWRASLIWRVKL